MESSRSSRSPSPIEERRFIDSWSPEPLVPEIDLEEHRSVLQPHVITSKPGKHIVVDGVECLNVGTHNYLGLADSPRLEKVSLDAVRLYGVGSCGPRAFYGTMDAHLELEKHLARFLDVQETVVYSFSFSTIASAIPAYAKATDTIYFDEQCNFAIQRGILASKCRAIKFAHNDADDLERRIEAFNKDQLRKHGKPKSSRAFLLVEGIYTHTGDICRLRELNEVAKKHKLRLFIDESRSFGVLGKEGKGITQHLNVDTSDIDIMMVSLENALCSFGGFCAGSSFVIDHQRLAGSGYCFSASLPPFQCKAALESLKIIEEDPSIVSKAQELFAYTHEKLTKLTHLQNISDPLSPIKILVDKASFNSRTMTSYVKDDAKRLERICDDILRTDKIAISVVRYLEEEEMAPIFASIRLILNGKLTFVDINRIFTALERSSSGMGRPL